MYSLATPLLLLHVPSVKEIGVCVSNCHCHYILYFIASLFSVDVFVAFVVGEDHIAVVVWILLFLRPRQTN